MARILNRPMFRRGGSANEGIMHGLVDRRGHAVGDRILEAKEWLSKIPQPRDTSLSEMLVGGGLNLVSGQGAGSGLMANVAQSFKGPSEQYFKRAGERRGYQGELDLAATKMGLEQDWAERLANIKAKEGTGLQKDYSPDRVYYELQKQYTDPKSNQLGLVKTIEQQFPSAMAELQAYIVPNIRKNPDPAVQDYAKNYLGTVPFVVGSTGQTQWNYKRMFPGGYYFQPEIKRFVQRDPEAGVIIEYDPYTLKELKRTPYTAE